MQHKLATWAAADQTRRFDRLLRLITDRNWLAEAARIVLASKGASTPGLDGMDKRRLAADLDRHLERLQVALLDGTYRPTPVKRIHIPKANGKLRPLGIPILLDRIVQRAMLMAMEPIWESDFHSGSYGFRPERSVHHAVRTVRMRAVLAWRLSNTMDTGFCIAALDEALARHGAPKIFNTDQGAQTLLNAEVPRPAILPCRLHCRPACAWCISS